MCAEDRGQPPVSLLKKASASVSLRPSLSLAWSPWLGCWPVSSREFCLLSLAFRGCWGLVSGPHTNALLDERQLNKTLAKGWAPSLDWAIKHKAKVWQEPKVTKKITSLRRRLPWAFKGDISKSWGPADFQDKRPSLRTEFCWHWMYFKQTHKGMNRKAQSVYYLRVVSN